MIDARKWLRRSVGEEFAGAELGDARRTARLLLIARVAAASPSVGFPQMVESDGELEGIYRFLSNEAVEPDAVLGPHIDATMKRARQAPLCLVIHDTTEFRFEGEAEREGLGLLSGNGQGFFGHFSLAVLPGPERIPLGICGLERICREVRKDEIRKPHSFYTAQDPARESLRWLRMLESIEDRREGFECIHVMDREGDMFDLMALAIGRGARFIIRGDKERALANQPGLVEDLLAQVEPVTHREAEVSARIPKRRELIKPKRGAVRRRRTAQLAVGCSSIEIKRPKVAHATERSLKINVVYAWETSPPKGEDPVNWVLFTTEPVSTIAELHAIIDNYQSRWTIEEFFKALKTGCGYEKRQLESYAALSNALAIFSVIAWRLLLVRSVARAYPHATSRSVLSDTQLRLLKHRLKLTNLPATAKDALYAVARLGGHLKNNGDPGWQTLGRGFEKLLILEAGWRAATDANLA